ncbi:MAG TPA: hypothetical protein VD884_23670 [Ohtaekwangia sp.]|nr:hypothetical protein [Ohtaekwangia sp.]
MRRIVSIAIALSLSLFIYLFYRSEKTVVNELMIFIISFDTYSAMRSNVIAMIALPESIVFSLPGGLWIFCVTMLSQQFYLKIGEQKIPLVIVPVLFAIGLEFCQLLHVTNGRFDVWDIVLYLLFWLIACDPFDSERPQQNMLFPFTLHSFIFLACFLSVYLAHVSQ